jgi:hypothetical protein
MTDEKPLDTNGLTRITVNLNRPALEALDSFTKATGYNRTDALNRAAQVLDIIHKIMKRHGGSLPVVHDDGTIERIHIL